jgi:hypothetical protein
MKLLGGDCRFGALERFLMRQLGGFVRFDGVIAGDHGMFQTSVMGAPIAVLGGSAVTLGCSFMMVCGTGVSIFWHEGILFKNDFSGLAGGLLRASSRHPKCTKVPIRFRIWIN